MPASLTASEERLIEDALALPVDARARLVEHLLQSLNPPLSEELDRVWADEAERRVEQLRSGQAKAIPGGEVFADIRARYGR